MRRSLIILSILLLGAYAVMLADAAALNPGGSDSSGYLNAAKLLQDGEVVVTVESLAQLDLPVSDARLFIPLGFTPGPEPGTMVSYYAPGTPLHFLTAALLFGWKWGPYFVNPLAASAALVLIFLLGRRLGLDRPWCFAASSLLALFPTLLFQAAQPMSDVLGLLWILAAMLAALESRSAPGWAWLAGAAVGLAVLVRPSNVLIFPALLLALPFHLRILSRFALGGLPAAALLLALNGLAFGHPFDTGYSNDLVKADLAFAFFGERFRHYVYWLSALMTPLPLLGWLGLPLVKSTSGLVRASLFVWFAAYLIFFSHYRHYDAWWYTRFLLPALPPLILGFLLTLRELSRKIDRQRARSRLISILLAAAVSLILLIEIWHAGDKHVQKFGDGEEIYAIASRVAPMRLPGEHPYVFAMQMSGAMEFYGQMQPVRWDYVDDDNRARLIDAIERRQRVYALLFDWEIEPSQERLRGRWREIDRYRQISLLVRE